MTFDLDTIMNTGLSLFTGGALVSLLTLGSQRKKAKSEAKHAEEDAEVVELSNADKIVKMQTEYIVEPLKKEISKLRTDVRRLNKAIDRIGDCPHSNDCPVRHQLQIDATDTADAKG